MDLRLDLEAARLEVDKLQADLEVAERNLRESAEQGLALLEAKSDLADQNELLEAELEKLRLERDGFREALLKSSHDRKTATNLDLEVEDDLLREKKQAEENFSLRISGLELENRSLKTQTERCEEETKKLQEAVKNLTNESEQLKKNNEKLHKKLQEEKESEKTTLKENEEFHKEIIFLRKNISFLELKTKEFESFKFETRKLFEENEILTFELKETKHFSEIVKEQNEEAWRILENERELRRNLQRQLHEQTDERDRWTRMETLRLEVEDPAEDPVEVSEVSEVAEGGGGAFHSSPFISGNHRQPSSLFHELQTLSTEPRTDLTDQLNLYKERLEQIQKITGALELLATSSSLTQSQITTATCEIRDLSDLRNLGDLGDLKDPRDPRDLTNRSVFLDEIQSQLTKRSTRQTVLEGEVKRLKNTIEIICEILIEKQLSINSCYDSLRSLRSSFSSSSSPNFSSNNTPSGPSQDGSSSPSQTSPRRSNKLEEEIRARLNQSINHLNVQSINNLANQPINHLNAQSINDLINQPINQLDVQSINSLTNQSINQLDVCIPDMVGVDVAADADMLMSAFEELKHQWQEMMGAAGGRGKEGGEEKVEELHEQIGRLKAHLGRKRDEGNLLKEALNNTQVGAERAMASLKAKYEGEKEASARTLMQLRRELNQRKEDAATFASIRSMLSARNDDYCTQLENVQRHLRSAEEEKRTLNSLLRMAIQQKLNLIHRVEDLECVLDGQQTQMRRREPVRQNRAIFRTRGRGNEQRFYGPH